MSQVVPQNTFTYRMGAGFAGEINRVHPFSSSPRLNDPSLPVLAYGLGVLVNAAGTGVRQVQSTDTGVTVVYGISVRPFPVQQSSTTNYGEADEGVDTPPPGEIDVLRFGYIMAPVNGAPVINAAAYLWIAASSAPHVQGGFETVSGGGSTVLLTNVTFNGPPDSSGIGEVIVNAGP